jgi:Mg2+ and Co2+ transporter CorA
VKPAIFTICAEWLVVTEYVKARLAQIEVELDKPKGFRAKGDVIERSLKRLHTWRRQVPVFREMVTEILEQDLPIASRLTAPPQMQNVPGGNMDDILPDFERVMRALNELQDRVDRLSSIVSSEISMEDSRHSLEENHNLARLTWLATTFIPLSFVTGLFSMTDDLSSMAVTFGWYFLAAVPLTIACMIVAARVGKGWREETKAKKQRETIGVGGSWTDNDSVRAEKSGWSSLFGAGENKEKGS